MTSGNPYEISDAMRVHPLVSGGQVELRRFRALLCSFDMAEILVKDMTKTGVSRHVLARVIRHVADRTLSFGKPYERIRAREISKGMPSLGLAPCFANRKTVGEALKVLKINRILSSFRDEYNNDVFYAVNIHCILHRLIPYMDTLQKSLEANKKAFKMENSFTLLVDMITSDFIQRVGVIIDIMDGKIYSNFQQAIAWGKKARNNQLEQFNGNINNEHDSDFGSLDSNQHTMPLIDHENGVPSGRTGLAIWYHAYRKDSGESMYEIYTNKYIHLMSDLITELTREGMDEEMIRLKLEAWSVKWQHLPIVLLTIPIKTSDGSKQKMLIPDYPDVEFFCRHRRTMQEILDSIHVDGLSQREDEAALDFLFSAPLTTTPIAAPFIQ